MGWYSGGVASLWCHQRGAFQGTRPLVTQSAARPASRRTAGKPIGRSRWGIRPGRPGSQPLPGSPAKPGQRRRGSQGQPGGCSVTRSRLSLYRSTQGPSGRPSPTTTHRKGNRGPGDTGSSRAGTGRLSLSCGQGASRGPGITAHLELETDGGLLPSQSSSAGPFPLPRLGRWNHCGPWPSPWGLVFQGGDPWKGAGSPRWEARLAGQPAQGYPRHILHPV